mmetsp:Transcript_15868/g.40308  ORF Transcript_15868/g.40308 Transcript_15868/m.40308 type:complete len:218 (-) Transcript_15868:103-756(-)
MKQLIFQIYPLDSSHSVGKKPQPEHRLGHRSQIARIPNVPDPLRRPVHRGGAGHAVRSVGGAGLALEPSPGGLGHRDLGGHQGLHRACRVGPQQTSNAASRLDLGLRWRRQGASHARPDPGLPPDPHRRCRRRRGGRRRIRRPHPRGGGGCSSVDGGKLGSEAWRDAPLEQQLHAALPVRGVQDHLPALCIHSGPDSGSRAETELGQVSLRRAAAHL